MLLAVSGSDNLIRKAGAKAAGAREKQRSQKYKITGRPKMVTTKYDKTNKDYNPNNNRNPNGDNINPISKCSPVTSHSLRSILFRTRL